MFIDKQMDIIEFNAIANSDIQTNEIVEKENTNTASKKFLSEIAEAKGVNPITGAIEPNWHLFPVAINAIYQDLDRLAKITKEKE